MKKLILTFVLLFGFQVYAQEFKTEKKKLNKELETELNKDYTAIDHDKVKELRKKLASLNNYIDTTKTVVYDFQKKEYTRSNVIPIVGEPLVLKIEKINRLAYDVSIKSSDVAIVDE
jgi:predicted nuclease with TOPRIM domain